MTQPAKPSLERLRALLHDADAAPASLLERLAAERQGVAGEEEVAHELLAAELRRLAAMPEARDPGIAAAIDDARRRWLDLRGRAVDAAAAADPATLFELADVAAEAELVGMDGLAARCRVRIDEVAAATAPGAELREEAAERLAGLIAAVEEPSLARQVAVLRANAAAMTAAGRVHGDPVLRRYGRRLVRVADDRALALRLERLLGRRGVVAYETANFVLLLVVLAILVVEFTVALPIGVFTALQWTDALACTFFIASFALEFALHPRRWSWFWRHVLTDLAPAIPSAAFLVPGGDMLGLADDAVALRSLRILRATWAARYVQMLRPLLRSARLLLFLVRGMDGLVQRFTQLLDREFVFAPGAAELRRTVRDDDRRDLVFAAFTREHELFAALSCDERRSAVLQRARAVAAQAAGLAPRVGGSCRGGPPRREMPIEEVVDRLFGLREQDVGRWLRPADVAALDRVLRVLSSVPVRWFPIVRSFAVYPLPASPEERVVALARRVGEWLGAWHARLQFHSDLHGIVTGPQILDRVATAMIKATQRPAVRLLLFGGLFGLFGFALLSEPFVVLGAFCLVFLSLGWWLKRLAGEAADAYRLTSEASFLPQLELVKLRYEDADLPFLAGRVFGDRAAAALPLLQAQVHSVRVGVPAGGDGVLRQHCNQVALLYLHFLDGAPLHQTDVKTTEQLLANGSLANLREHFLGETKRDRKRLWRLRLDEGSVLSGPYLWFSFITESIAVETAKRVHGYNRCCVPVAERETASPSQLAAMADWLASRRDPKGGRTLAAKERVRQPACTSEFTALDFVGGDDARDRYLAEVFGDDVLATLQLDRRTMIREIFGTRPVHQLPQSQRSFNPLQFYKRRLSRGRVLLAPLWLLWRFVRFVGWLVVRIRQIVREVIDPELAMQRRVAGQAPFAVALRKIHRMKAPGLLAAIRLRIQLDPVYSGAPTRFGRGGEFAATTPLDRDLAFLHVHEREWAELRDRSVEVRRAVARLHATLPLLPPFPTASAQHAEAGELAVTCAWIADKDRARTLLAAERWRAEHVPTMVREGVPGTLLGDLWRACFGLFRVHRVDRWLASHGRDLPAGARRPLRRAHARNLHDTRTMLDAWSELPAGTSPAEHAIRVLHDAFRRGPAIARDLAALRTVQSLAVLDIRNYRDLVFRLGGYAEDGEDGNEWASLP